MSRRAEQRPTTAHDGVPMTWRGHFEQAPKDTERQDPGGRTMLPRRIYPTEGGQEAEQLSRAARNPRDEGLEERRRTTAPAHVPHTTLKISQIEIWTSKSVRN